MKLIGMFACFCVAVATHACAEQLLRVHRYCWNRAEGLVDAVSDAVLEPEEV